MEAEAAGEGECAPMMEKEAVRLEELEDAVEAREAAEEGVA